MKHVSLVVVRLALVCLLAAAVGFGLSWADGTNTLGPPSITIVPGTDILSAGVGLLNGQPGTISLNVPSDVTVAQTLLYYTAVTIDSDCATTPGDDTVMVNGMMVTADAITEPLFFNSNLGPACFFSYRANISSLGAVEAGITNNVEVGGIDFDFVEGAGILAIIDDGGAPAIIDIRDGADFVFVGFGEVAVPQSFSFPVDNDSERTAEFTLMAAAVEQGRPNGIAVTVGGEPTVKLFDVEPETDGAYFDSKDGDRWDSVVQPMAIPVGSTSITIEALSEAQEGDGRNPASLLWNVAALKIEEMPPPPPQTCWITGGGFHTGGSNSDPKVFTFGGNVGKPPAGSWEVIDHQTQDNFHSNDVAITSCEVIEKSGPGQPGGNKGFTINRAHFEGTGRLNHVDGFCFTGFIDDAGEPEDRHNNDSDTFEVIVTDCSGMEAFVASGDIDGGNLQIHPPVGNQN